MLKRIAGVAVLGLLAAGCTNASPSSVSSTAPNAAPSGITSSNGGGMRATGNIPNVGVSNGQATMGGVPNRSGNAY